MTMQCTECGSNSIVKNGKKSGKYQQYHCHGCGSRKKPYIPEVVGVIGDIHAPFTHPRYMEFIKDTFVKWDVNRVVFIGDLVDNHAISRHLSETDAFSADNEYILAKQQVKQWCNTFPEAVITLGNHDKIPKRRAQELGLPDHFLKSFSQQWELPPAWEVCNSKIINGVKHFHGMNCAGKLGSYNRAIKERMSIAIGHGHSIAGVNYHANYNSLILGMAVGCGFDVEAYAARYGIEFIDKPILGCGIEISKSEAYFVPMNMNKYSREVK